MITTTTGLPFALTANTTKTQQAINATIAKHNAAEEKLDARQEALAAIPAATWTPKNIAEADKIRAERLELIKNEISIRQELVSYFQTIATVDYPAAYDKAIADSETATAEIDAALRALGYVDRDGQQIVAAMAVRHPRVAALNFERGAMQTDSYLPAVRANDAEIEALNLKLNAIKDAALAV